MCEAESNRLERKPRHRQRGPVSRRQPATANKARLSFSRTLAADVYPYVRVASKLGREGEGERAGESCQVWTAGWSLFAPFRTFWRADDAVLIGCDTWTLARPQIGPANLPVVRANSICPQTKGSAVCGGQECAKLWPLCKLDLPGECLSLLGP